MVRILIFVLLGYALALSAAFADEQKERALSIVGPMAGQEPRIALVIGNGGYQSISPLDNPVRDADLIAQTLERVGFQVTRIVDSDQATMKRSIADFGRALRQAGPDATALFYYAGHAVQSFGNNYLLPVDSLIRDQADLDLVGVEADWVLRQLFSARIQTSIVILDACRNNPFANINGFERQGLAEMNAPTGSFIAYATAPGRVAFDGTQGNSPYTAALANAILTTRQPIEQLFKSVRIDVLRDTKGAQTPWDSSSLTSDFYFNTFEPEPNIQTAEQSLWNRVKLSTDPSHLRLFLETYPASTHANEAQDRLAALSPDVQNPSNPPLSQDASAGGAIYFAAPLQQGGDLFVGRTIAQLVQGQPRFPPFEGIPKELWEGQKCTNCHQWTQDLLCDQGRFYMGDESERSLAKEHPYGGGFKKILKTWAASGCQ